MKTSAIYALICWQAALLSSCCVVRPAYDPGNDHTDMNLSGNVYRIHEREYDLTLGDTVDPDQYHIMEFDAAGNLTRLESIDPSDSTTVAVQRYFYDAQGRLERSTEENFIQDYVFVDTYLWEKDGRVEKRYNTYGDLISERTYGRKGYPKKEVRYAGDTVAGVSVYRYDRRGNIKWEKDGERTIRYSYRKGVLEKEVYDSSFYVTYYPNGNVRSINYVIDMNIGLKEDVFRDTMEAEIVATYTYDEHGNWIRRENVLDGRPLSVTVREIEYYP